MKTWFIEERTASGTFSSVHYQGVYHSREEVRTALRTLVTRLDYCIVKEMSIEDKIARVNMTPAESWLLLNFPSERHF